MATLFVLVGAEGVGEMLLEGQTTPGIRKATDAEEASFRSALELIAKAQGMQVADWYIDHMGRPYWLIAVEENAPAPARDKAAKYKRVVRLLD